MKILLERRSSLRQKATWRDSEVDSRGRSRLGCWTHDWNQSKETLAADGVNPNFLFDLLSYHSLDNLCLYLFFPLEIKDVKRKKERAKELEGIDMSNIVSSTRRRSTSNFILPPKPKVPVESDEDEEEESDDDDDDNDEGSDSEDGSDGLNDDADDGSD